jgi:hypothetical protein
MGKPTVVAERHWKLARHNVPGKTSDKTLRPAAPQFIPMLILNLP